VTIRQQQRGVTKVASQPGCKSRQDGLKQVLGVLYIVKHCSRAGAWRANRYHDTICLWLLLLLLLLRLL
jgi:hypothetical protein